MSKRAHDSAILKKIGEVYAFTEVGIDTFERGQDAMIQAFSEEDVEEILNELNSIQEQLDLFISQCESPREVTDKAERTANKLVNMRDMYINDQWDDATELLEWLGFFEGAAIVHWGLIVGYITGGAVTELADTAHQSMTFHQNFLTRVAETLIEVGTNY